MASVTFQYIYVSPTTTESMAIIATAQEWTLTADPDTWEPGQQISAYSATAGANPTFYYEGVTADGELVLNFSPDLDDTQYLLSDTLYVSATPFPDFASTAYAACFAAGTLIATASGDVKVEDLKAGDILRTADGGTTTVKWLGRHTVATLFADATTVCPVRISAGALADNVPTRDLLVTGDHGLVFDEAIVHASALVNGTTIARVAKAELTPLVTYYHIETDGHAVILAEGTPAETFIDNLGREKFDNFAEYVAMYGAEQDDIEPLGLPRARTAREVPNAIKARIAARAPLFASVA